MRSGGSAVARLNRDAQRSLGGCLVILSSELRSRGLPQPLVSSRCRTYFLGLPGPRPEFLCSDQFWSSRYNERDVVRQEPCEGTDRNPVKVENIDWKPPRLMAVASVHRWNPIQEPDRVRVKIQRPLDLNDNFRFYQRDLPFVAVVDSSYLKTFF